MTFLQDVLPERNPDPPDRTYSGWLVDLDAYCDALDRSDWLQYASDLQSGLFDEDIAIAMATKGDNIDK